MVYKRVFFTVTKKLRNSRRPSLSHSPGLDYLCRMLLVFELFSKTGFYLFVYVLAAGSISGLVEASMRIEDCRKRNTIPLKVLFYL